jgi:hypothetical protein
MVDGDLYVWQKTSEALKTMSFKKIPELLDISESHVPEVRASSSTSKRSVPLAKSSHIGTKAAGAPYKPPTRIKDISHSRIEQDLQEDAEDEYTPQPKLTRPKPSPRAKLPSKRSVQRPNNEPAPSRPTRASQPVEQICQGLGKGKEKDSSKSDVSRLSDKKDHRKISAFPMDDYSPVKEKVAARDFPMSPPQKATNSRAHGSQSSYNDQSSCRPKKQLPASNPMAAFPTLSPLSSPSRHAANTKVLRLSSTKAEPQNSDRASTSHFKDLGNDTPRTRAPKFKSRRRELQPFPMETQDLKSIDHNAWDTFEDAGTSSSEEDRGRKRARGGDEMYVRAVHINSFDSLKYGIACESYFTLTICPEAKTRVSQLATLYAQFLKICIFSLHQS